MRHLSTNAVLDGPSAVVNFLYFTVYGVIEACFCVLY